MIVKITAHKTSPNVVVVHAGPDLAEFMGAFPGARWQDKPKAYWLPTEQLETFARHVARCGHHLVDERSSGAEPEKFTGPLPECTACGQPASRSAALALTRCPACGAPWRPMVAESPAATGAWSPKVDCAACGRRQRIGWAFCGGCGAVMPPAGAPGPRPDTVDRPVIERPRLEEPALFGDLVGEVADELEPDHMKRAAGDR